MNSIPDVVQPRSSEVEHSNGCAHRENLETNNVPIDDYQGAQGEPAAENISQTVVLVQPPSQRVVHTRCEDILPSAVSHGRLTKEQKKLLINLNIWYLALPKESQFFNWFAYGQDELPSSYQEIQLLQGRQIVNLITTDGQRKPDCAALDCAAVAGVNNSRIQHLYHNIGSALNTVARQNPLCAELVVASKKYIKNILGSCDSSATAIKRCDTLMKNTHPDKFHKHTYDANLNENIKTIFQLLGTLKDIFTSDECQVFALIVFAPENLLERPRELNILLGSLKNIKNKWAYVHEYISKNIFKKPGDV